MPEAIDDFLSHLHSLDRSPNTTNAYKLDLLQFAEWSWLAPVSWST